MTESCFSVSSVCGKQILIAYYSSSRINAHLMFPLFPENRKYSFSGKKTFKNCNPPDFKFYPSKLTNKIFCYIVLC